MLSIVGIKRGYNDIRNYGVFESTRMRFSYYISGSVYGYIQLVRVGEIYWIKSFYEAFRGLNIFSKILDHLIGMGYNLMIKCKKEYIYKLSKWGFNVIKRMDDGFVVMKFII